MTNAPDTDCYTQLVTIVERIMTMHWDLAACRCWVCVDGRAAGCRPREQYLAHNDRGERPMVTVLQIKPHEPDVESGPDGS